MIIFPSRIQDGLACPNECMDPDWAYLERSEPEPDPVYSEGRGSDPSNMDWIRDNHRNWEIMRKRRDHQARHKLLLLTTMFNFLWRMAPVHMENK